METGNINIYGKLVAQTGEGKVADTDQIFDKTLGKFQSEINGERENYYTKDEIDSMVEAIKQFNIQIANTLPEASESTMFTIYLIPSSNPKTTNSKDEYITVKSGNAYSWEQVGSTEIDLSGYSTTEQMNAAILSGLNNLSFSTGEKVANLGIDEEPTANSDNLAKSGGVKKAVDGVEQVNANEPQGEFTIKNIVLSELQTQSLSIDFKTNIWTSGNHYTIDCGGAEYMYVETGETSVNIAIIGKELYFPRNNYSVNAEKVLNIHQNYKGYIQLPEDTTACFINSDNLPTKMVLYINEDKPVTFYGKRLMVDTDSNSISVDSNTRWNMQFIKVKAGNSYQFRYKVELPEGTNYFSATAWFLPEYPILDLPVDVIVTKASNQKVEYVRTATPTDDGYCMVGVYSTKELLNEIGSREIENLIETENIRKLTFLEQNIRSFGVLRNRISTVKEPHAVEISASQYHVEIPVTPQNKFVHITTVNYSSYIAFLTDTLPTDGTTAVPYAGDSVLLNIPKDKDYVLNIPDGTKYLYVYLGSTTAYTYNPNYLALSFEVCDFPDIVRVNDYLGTKRFLEQVTGKTRYETNELVDYKPLCLLHYSDLHGYIINQNRINDFRSVFADFIDDSIQTGDLLADKFTDNIPFGDVSTSEAIAINPNRNILAVIGNHDTQGTSSQGWHYYQGLPIYNKLIAPFKEYWGIEQPVNADTQGYCFYYKDYTRSRIRLVVIDPWNNDDSYNEVQKTWFQDTLESARTSGLSVIVASHYRPVTEEILDTSFTKLDGLLNPDDTTTNVIYKQYVDAFQEAGGDFVCWLAGHSHYDFTSKIVTPNTQISICIGNACMWYHPTRVTNLTNSMHISVPNDSKSWDLFNLITFDNVYHLITLYRIGSNWDKYGRYIKSCCINYRTGNVIWK